MKTVSGSVRWYALVGAIAVVLATLAYLQYRAIGQISRASAGQILATLQGALMDFRQGVERELTPLGRQFALDDGLDRDTALTELTERFAEWQRASAHPKLVSELYIWRDVGSAPQLLRLDPSSRRFGPAKWPQDAAPLQAKLQEMSAGLSSPNSPIHLDSGAEFHGPRHGRDHPEYAFGWFIDQRIPMLVHPVPERTQAGAPPQVAWIMLRLNRDTLWSHLFPEVAQRTFGEGERAAEEFAFSDGTPAHTLVLSSDGQFGKPGSPEPDAVLNIFGRPLTVVKKGQDSHTTGSLPPAFNFTPDRPLRIDPLEYETNNTDWAILGKSQKGSIDAAVKSLFYRSLATNFGVLLLLTIAIVSLIVSTQRARQLSQMQMDFVANISHELRTPLTGISAAAQNIVDGVVQKPERVVSYGNAILRQSHNLSDLVEQILLFSATQKQRYRYMLEPVQVSGLVSAALERTSTVLKQAGAEVEVNVAPDLPEVNVDRKAMVHCLQNLITNAVKYGGAKPWVGIQAHRNGTEGRDEIEIAVRDRGIGIGPDQLRLIFEPFYRTPDATAAQIHGSGLGLPLAKSIAEAMGGRLTVDSAPNEGSTFTVHLPTLK
jgi:signal transduction histidine kinase